MSLIEHNCLLFPGMSPLTLWHEEFKAVDHLLPLVAMDGGGTKLAAQLHG